MVRYMMRFSYIGTRYSGLQKQTEHKANPPITIQGAIEAGLKTLNPLNVPRTLLSSRTDKGVHALMNVLHVDLSHPIAGEIFQPHVITQYVNNYLREENHDILAIKSCVVPDAFHARFSAKWRRYIYRLAIKKPEVNSNLCSYFNASFLPILELNNCHVVRGPLNINRMKSAMRLFLGLHDFTTFSSFNVNNQFYSSPLKFIDRFDFYPLSTNEMQVSDPQYSNLHMWEFCVQSHSFFYHQVRKMVGAIIAIGRGIITEENIQWMLDNPNFHNWNPEVISAPARGLFLAHVHYDENVFALRNEDNIEEVFFKLRGTNNVNKLSE